VAVLRFALAILASVAVILSSPFIRDIRDWIRAQFPGHFVTVIAIAIGLAILCAIVLAIVRIRERRALRYGLIVIALAFGAAYAKWNAQGIPEVDVVERFHFVEYGLVTFLFYRAWRPLGDASMFVLPVLAGLLVGTFEEWLQWFIPGRVGDMRDVFLNGAAIMTGLLFSIGLDPPDKLASIFRPGSVRRILIGVAAVLVVFAAFVHSVHLGYEIADADGGRFRSRYESSTLAELSVDRAARWKRDPPVQRPPSRSREDQYFSEGLWHVQERNRRWEAGDIPASWSENVILEKYYRPVIVTPSYISKTGLQWPDAQRVDAERRAAAMRTTPAANYESRADAAEGRHFIRLWPKPTFWMIVVIVAGAMLALAMLVDRGR
jgi:hypothetical protein